ncbi:hypothetical protein FB565_002984 [Actinoplanes lutulentus]|uniref:Uncharacterized protein n=1 Tax=Actinoplanes lutulentus TaxID=1287878 RepID=A0A327Z9Y0_9ACTN|nr:hypothetical protein [Actinoplanes lutulentus]MBB2943271.1 hypothetical protein [Actinoplanes lutulentus]RAK28331.1 hypothetical protein B0I29_12099 [Actinoplanes lutulentus]
MIILVTLTTVLLVPWLARRLQEARGYVEVALKVVGFYFKISFTPESPPSAGAAEVQPPESNPDVGPAGSPASGGDSP